ncbi:MAG: SDR family NAD(P)-dependent oxidoreductase [Actinomycetota bacterium]|nr:SDR family NAD(P)-dependent oxidoreductase [Actinomycetota bacterium]
MPQPRRAVVTGAARGLGRAIALRLASDGFEVVALDVDGGGAEATAAACGGMAVSCDVSDRRSVAAAAEQAERDGPVEVLVNNAGIWTYGPLIGASQEDIDRVISVNLLGTLHCCRAFAPGMVAAGRGAVVNLSSLAAAMAATGVEIYPVTKGAVEMVTRQLALELGPSGVRVNAIGPGNMLTEGTAPAYEGDRMAARAASVPLRRIGLPADIANAVAFLVSDQASYISGQVIYVDGGVSAMSR